MPYPHHNIAMQHCNFSLDLQLVMLIYVIWPMQESIEQTSIISKTDQKIYVKLLNGCLQTAKCLIRSPGAGRETART